MHRCITVRCSEAVNGDGHSQGVMYGCANLRPLWHSDERACILQWVSGFTESIDAECDAVLCFRVPFSQSNFELNCQYSLAESPRLTVIWICNNRAKGFAPRWQCEHVQQKDRQDAAHAIAARRFLEVG